MKRVVLKSNGSKKIIDIEVGSNLLTTIQNSGLNITAPCGGAGTCGKCRVDIDGYGEVDSCSYTIEKDIEVTIPDRRESKVLMSQHRYNYKLPIETGLDISKSPFPMGVAIDLGTTTVVLYLVNLITGVIEASKGVANPQDRFGSDVISRIEYSSNSNGINNLKSVVVDTINREIDSMTDKFGVDPSYIEQISVAGNTTMLHMLIGVDPMGIALAPFKPKFTDRKVLLASEYGLNISPKGVLELLPSISAYVGADIVAGIASIAPQKDITTYLFIDIGTNGEMALVTPEGIWCCATAAGPAFEGASIECGSGAISGAISSFDGEKLTTVSNSKPESICGSGLIDIVAHLLTTGTVSSDGELKENYQIEGSSLYITPQDIREIQLAKSAIYSGIKILLDIAKIDMSSVDTLLLAGGLGNYIDPKSAVKVGILPTELIDKIVPIGNSSGSGAILDLKSTRFKSIVDSVAERAKVVDLSTHDEFSMEFAMNMYFQ